MRTKKIESTKRFIRVRHFDGTQEIIDTQNMSYIEETDEILFEKDNLEDLFEGEFIVQELTDGIYYSEQLTDGKKKAIVDSVKRWLNEGKNNVNIMGALSTKTGMIYVAKMTVAGKFELI